MRKEKLIIIQLVTMLILSSLTVVSSSYELDISYPHFKVNVGKDILLPIEGPKIDPTKIVSTGGVLIPMMDLSHIKGDYIPEEFMTSGPPPSSFDWRTQSGGKINNIRNQGTCGSCYAFAAIANFESKVMIDTATNPPGPDYSENNAKECNWREINNWIDGGGNPWGGCSGGDHRMLASLFSQKGVVLESCDPYVQSDTGSCKSSCPYQSTLLQWRMISARNIPSTTTLKTYIQNIGPVFSTLYVGDSNDPSWQSTFNSYSGGVLSYPSCPYNENHAVLIIGWDDSLGSAGAWIVRNQWGNSWGSTCGGTERGYFYIEYGSANIGYWSSTMDQWQNYDSNGGILYYDEDCWSNNWGYSSLTAWGLCKYTPTSNINITGVEFWTNDRTTDVDVYIYDSFDGTTLGNLLWSGTDNVFPEAGYHIVKVTGEGGINVVAGFDVIVVTKFTNHMFPSPVTTDANGPSQTGCTYMSPSGASGSWTDMGTFASEDVAIRLRYSLSSNNPPNTPSNPNPANHATGVDVNADMSWTGGDPDVGDTVTYDVYYGTSSPPPSVATGQSATTYDPGTMSAGTKHYWQIVAWDNNGASTSSPIWDFTTAGGINNPPDKPQTPSGKTNGKAGILYPYSTKAIDSDGDKLRYGWDWTGDGSVDQWDDNSGSYYTSGVTISTSHSWPSQGTYTIKVIAEDINGAQSVWSDPLVVSMPKNKPYLFSWFYWFLEQHPFLFPLLRQLLQL